MKQNMETYNDTKLYAQISSYMGRLLREKFGKGPTSIFVTINKPYITIYLRDFLAPIERVLLEKGEWKRIEETRDVLMQELFPEIRKELKVIADLDVEDLHYDWNLDIHSGIVFGSIKHSDTVTGNSGLSKMDEEQFYTEINKASERGQKVPEKTEVFWLNDRTIVTKRTGILVEIEKQLIKNDFVEELKLTKRPMEKKMVDQKKLEDIIGKSIIDTFVDWNFEKDIGYFVFVTTPKKDL
ncbi:Na-translocating system protein MpsC family protein [Salipaludibacillus sp. HK11]|uniref:Na-translocating system protein MpsC family protein n=1 Tax=Salipaludibacillus sp. HK11 TaxID=3394320 RepID=UPI0039FD5500